MLLLSLCVNGDKFVRVKERSSYSKINGSHKDQNKASILLRGLDSGSFFLLVGSFDRSDSGVHDESVVKSCTAYGLGVFLPLGRVPFHCWSVYPMRFFQYLDTNSTADKQTNSCYIQNVMMIKGNTHNQIRYYIKCITRSDITGFWGFGVLGFWV